MGFVNRAPRKAVNLLIKLNFPSEDAFAIQYATNVSPGGMFIRTRQPKPIGTRLQFQVELANGSRVLHGSATVQWVRPPNDPKGPPGMGIQFDELDPASRSLVDRMAQGKELVSSDLPPAAAPAPMPLPKAEPIKDSVLTASDFFGSEGAEDGLDLDRLIADTLAQTPDQPRPVTPLSLAKPEMEVDPLSLVSPLDSPANDFDVSVDAPLPEAPPDAGLGLLDGIDLDAALSIPTEPIPEAPPPVGKAAPKAAVPAPTPRPKPAAPPAAAPPAPASATGKASAPASARAKAAPAAAPAAPARSTTAPVPPGAAPPAAAKSPPAPAPATPPAPGGAPAAAPTVAKPAKAAEVPAAAPLDGALPSIRRKPAEVPAPAQAKPVVLTAPAKAPKAATGSPVASIARPVYLSPAAERAEAKGPVIGIDLGTTNSCVAVFSKGKPTVLRSKEGYWTIPSILSVTPQGKLLVGHRAKQQLILNPGRTVYGAKRLLGREFGSATVKQVRSRSHFEIVEDEAGRAAVRLGENAITLEEAQGLVLRECREMAEQELGTKIERAVITCPAYYSEPQREGVRRAGTLAGLKVERVLNEPTAAALAFGVGKELSKKVLVYDLGGGTFDATLLRIDQNVFEVLATGGDIFLGGTDFDNQIVDFLLEALADQPDLDVKADAVLLSRVTEAAEHAKVALSERSSHDVHIPMLMMGKDGKPVDLRRTISRADLNRLVGDLVDRTLEVVHDVLLDAKLAASDIDEVILVGGQSRMPLVREKLAELFKKPPHASVNADEAVALGAATFASTIDKICSVVLIDVVPMTIGIGLKGGAFRRVIERNTPLPVQKSMSLPTVEDNQTTLEFSLFQGEDPSIAGNEYLGTVRVEDIPAAPKGAAKVAVTLKLDSECVLHVEALEMTTRKKIQATLATRYSSEELQKKLAVSKDKVAEAEAKRGKDLERRAGRFWGFLKKVVGKG